MSLHPIGSYEGGAARDLLPPTTNLRDRRSEIASLPAPEKTPQPSIAELFGDIVTDAQIVIRKELELAKVELEDVVEQTTRRAKVAAAGGVLALGGGLILLFMVAHLVASTTVLPLWASYGIVGGVVFLAGVTAFIIGGKRLKAIDPVPRETADAVRKDAQWIAEQNPLSTK